MGAPGKLSKLHSDWPFGHGYPTDPVLPPEVVPAIDAVLLPAVPPEEAVVERPVRPVVLAPAVVEPGELPPEGVPAVLVTPTIDEPVVVPPEDAEPLAAPSAIEPLDEVGSSPVAAMQHPPSRLKQTQAIATGSAFTRRNTPTSSVAWCTAITSG
jgi:hypothetical protein